MTRALTQGLVRRLPGFIVTNESAGRPARQVLAEIETFEPRANGSVVLVAQWRVLDGSGRERLSGERVSLVEPIASSGDAATAAAMTAAIEDFADRVAAGVQRTAPATRAAAEARKHSHPAQR
ncbi:MAG: membrane integrity-associated transporter subunit PqiC [Acetobacteraceae bacterium]|nr:membrane integrity-associated transporter subunit PqiC [Acetobacteraceae bacterium]